MANIFDAILEKEPETKPEKKTVKKKKEKPREAKYFIDDVKLTKYIVENIGEINRIKLPNKEGEQLVLVTDMKLNSITFLYLILKQIGRIDELYMSYYSFNLTVMDIIEKLIENKKIGKFYFQTNTLRKYGSDSKIPKKLVNMIKVYGNDIVAGSFIQSHAKVMICKVGDKHYSIEGSGNMAKKERTEQYLIDMSEKTYNFHRNWITNYERREVIK